MKLRDIILEYPHALIANETIPHMFWLILNGAYVDLGLENYPESHLTRNYIQALHADGLKIPYTNASIRIDGTTLSFGPAADDQMELPTYWAQAMLVLNDDDSIRWIGKLVRPEQYGRIDSREYLGTPDGLLQRAAIPSYKGSRVLAGRSPETAPSQALSALGSYAE